MIRFRWILLFGILVVFGESPLAADATSSPNTIAGFGDPYTREEFPEWMLELRRGESLFFGSFPIFFIFSGLGYDYYYYYYVSGQNSANVPWPTGPGTSQWTTTSNAAELSSKTKTLLMVSATASLTLVVVDWLIGKWTQ